MIRRKEKQSRIKFSVLIAIDQLTDWDVKRLNSIRCNCK